MASIIASGSRSSLTFSVQGVVALLCVPAASGRSINVRVENVLRRLAVHLD